MMRRLLSIGFLTSILAISAYAAWEPREFTCPIDGEKNIFFVFVSYGSNGFTDASSYQGLFFPKTDPKAIYLCKKCHLATYMWDFNKLPKAKLAEIRAVLAGVAAPGVFREYTDVPVTTRLEIMEKVYKVLGRDEYWWEYFFRLEGYHYGQAGETEKAAAARTRSLNLLQDQLDNPADPSPRKLTLYLAGAMHHFLGDDSSALTNLGLALKTRYTSTTEKPDAVAAAEANLNQRISDFITRIRSNRNKPRSTTRATGATGATGAHFSLPDAFPSPTHVPPL